MNVDQHPSVAWGKSAHSILIGVFAERLRFNSARASQIFEGQFGEARCQNGVGAVVGKPLWAAFSRKYVASATGLPTQGQAGANALSVIDKCRGRTMMTLTLVQTTGSGLSILCGPA
jgi:hypothetical protein